MAHCMMNNRRAQFFKNTINSPFANMKAQPRHTREPIAILDRITDPIRIAQLIFNQSLRRHRIGNTQ